MLLVGGAIGEISSSFSASDGEATVGFSTVFGADIEDRISDGAIAAFSGGLGLSRTLQAAGDLHERHSVNDAANGLYAMIEVDVSNAEDSIYRYVMYPGEGEVGPSAYVQARQSLTSINADDIDATIQATNYRGCRATGNLRNGGTVQGYIGTARATVDCATVSQSVDHIDTIPFITTELFTCSETVTSEVPDLYTASQRLTLEGGSADNYKASSTARPDRAATSLTSVEISVPEGEARLQMGSFANSLGYSTGFLTDLASGQAALSASVGVDATRAWADIPSIDGSGSINSWIRAGDVTWNFETIDTGTYARSYTNLASGDLLLSGYALDRGTDRTVQVHTEGEGTIAQDLAAQDEDLAVFSTSHVLVDGGALTYDGLAKGYSTGVSTETDLQAQAPEGSVEYILTAGDITQQASALYEGEEDDEPVLKDEYLTYEQVLMLGNPGYFALFCNAPVDVKKKVNFLRSILKIHEDVKARAEKIDNFLNAHSTYGDESSKIQQIMKLDNAGDFFQDARFHIAFDKNWNGKLVEITYNTAPEPEVQSSLASIPPLPQNGEQARFYQMLEAVTPGCSSDILYASDELEVYDGAVQGSYRALTGGGGTSDAYAAIAIDDLSVETTDSGTGSEIRHYSGATNGLMSTSSTTHLQTTGSDTETGASLTGSGTILAADDLVQQRVDIDGGLASPGNAYFYINSLYGENDELSNSLRMEYDYGYPGQNPLFGFNGLALARSIPDPQATINYGATADGGDFSLYQSATTKVESSPLLELVDGPSAHSTLEVLGEGAGLEIEGAIVSSGSPAGKNARITNRNVQATGQEVTYNADACKYLDYENNAGLYVRSTGDAGNPANLWIGNIVIFADQSGAQVNVNDLQAQSLKQDPYSISLNLWGGVRSSVYSGVTANIGPGNIAFSGHVQDMGSDAGRSVRETTSSLSAAGGTVEIWHQAFGGDGCNSGSTAWTFVSDGEVKNLYAYATATPLTTLAYQRAVADGPNIIRAIANDGVTMAYGSIQKDFSIFYYTKAWTDPDPHEQDGWRIY
ncbi:MAG: hypothetical protein JW986_10500 [Methanotrichaceae archaeon]|nr:hypothetical protein [Methanotrichaceae archaeon]